MAKTCGCGHPQSKHINERCNCTCGPCSCQHYLPTPAGLRDKWTSANKSLQSKSPKTVGREFGKSPSQVTRTGRSPSRVSPW